MPVGSRKQVTAIVRDLERFTERLVVKITLDVTGNLIETTPVDTGWARANWVPSVGKRSRRPAQSFKGKTPSASVQAAAAKQSAGQAQALGYKLARGRVYVNNNVRYITRLNDGYSRQAPPGFVQRGIRKAVTQDIRTFRG